MRSVLPTALILIATASAPGAQPCAGGICSGTISPFAGLPRAIAGGAVGSPRSALGQNAYDFRSDALGVTRDPAGNILPTDSLGLTRTRDGRICTRDANGLLQCR